MHQRIIKGQRSIATRLVFGLATVVGCSLIYSLALGNAASATNFNPSLTLTTQAPVGKTNLRPGSDKDYSNYSVSVKIDSTDISNYSISVKANSSDMVGTTNKNNKLKSVPSGAAKTLNQMNNEWGYRWNLSEAAQDDPLKNYSAVPTTNTVVTPKYYLGAKPGVSATRYFTLGFGAAVNQTQPADTYTNNVTVSIVGEPLTDSFFTISNMQDMYSDICATATTPSITATGTDTTGAHQGDSSYVPERTLTDTRNSTGYTVRKLADGNCWMAQDLDFNLGGYSSPETPLADSFRLTNEDTDLNGILTEWTPSIAKAKYNLSNVYETTSDNGAWNNSDSIYSFGNGSKVMYNEYAVTLGSINDMSASAISVCPRGWRITTDADLENLIGNTYQLGDINNGISNPSRLTSFPFNFDGGAFEYGSYLPRAFIWVVYDGPQSLGTFRISDGFIENTSTVDGQAVRCIAR